VKTIVDPTSPTASGDLIEAAVGRLREAVALLEAIDRGELLAELPSQSDAAVRHQCAVSLLAVLRRELDALTAELESAGYVQDLLSRMSRSSQRD
jgi:hypothetical protein